MIRPDENFDLSMSVIRIGGLIIRELLEVKSIRFDYLLAALIDQTDERVKKVFIPALSFLFLLGKIRYHKRADTFELVNQ